MRKTIRRALITGLATGSCLLLTAEAASAGHFLPDDSVDGGEIRYENQTQYDGALTASKDAWNAVGSTDLKPDAWNVVADLEISDVHKTDVAWDGAYQARAGADAIYMNTAYLVNYSATKRRSVMAHEIGHAYGLGDHESSSYSSALMYHCATCSGKTAPQSHDKSDWRQKWS